MTQTSKNLQPLSSEPSKGLIILCFGLIYIVWGSTYLFATFALEQIPAFKLCGIRYLVASVITFLIVLSFGNFKWPPAEEIKNAFKAGFIFMGLGTGGAIWALNFLDSGLTALIIAGEPLIIVLMMWLVNQKRPPTQAFIGIFMGLLGMLLLVSQKSIVSTPDQWKGVLVILLSMIAWGGGSIFVSKVKLPDSEWTNATIQMFSGGLTTYLISLVIGESGISIPELTRRTWISLAYLIIFGSVAAFTAFNYLLRNVSTEKVVTNTYVNPVIAMILGYLYNGELVTMISIIAAAIMLSGVFIINTNKREKKKAP